MIEIKVNMANKYESREETVEISKDELLQLACNKARQRYEDSYWTIIIADHEIIIKL